MRFYMKIQICVASVLEGSAWPLCCVAGCWFAIVKGGDQSVVYCEDAGFKFRVDIVAEAFGLLNSQFSTTNLNKLPPMVGVI